MKTSKSIYSFKGAFDQEKNVTSSRKINEDLCSRRYIEAGQYQVTSSIMQKILSLQVIKFIISYNKS